MAGYNHQRQMSNNAVRDIDENGIVPFYELPIPTPLLAKYFRADEWHHVGKEYYWAPFLQQEKILAFFGIIYSRDHPKNEQATKEYEELVPRNIRLKTIVLKPTAHTYGHIPPEYPYDEEGEWRMSQKCQTLRTEMQLPWTDEVVERLACKLTLTYQKALNSTTTKQITLPLVTVSKLKSGFLRFELSGRIIIRHPSQLDRLEPVYSPNAKELLALTKIEHAQQAWGPVPEEYPYSVSGRWRLSKELRIARGMPAVDKPLEVRQVTNFSFSYRRNPRSKSKTITFHKVTIVIRASGYWQFSTFVRHPSQLN